MKLTILTDKLSWMGVYSRRLGDIFCRNGHTCSVIQSKNDICKGDVAFFLGCFQLIDKELLSLNRHNIVVHESALPEGKGWSPITWQILEGKSVVPITLFEAVEKVDAGDVYIRDEIRLDGTELIEEIREKQANKTIEMCILFVKNMHTLDGKKQQGESTFYRRRKPEDSELDINKTINEQFNLLRVIDNERYPAFFVKNRVKYILNIRKADG
jgi:methionyl-tRNA formyltransferase